MKKMKKQRRETEPSDPWVIEPEELAYFRDHLGAEDRRDYDAIQAVEGNAVAFGHALKKVLRDDYPDLRVNFPGRRLQ